MFRWDFPIDTKGIIEDADTTIGFRMLEIITLVLEDGGLGEDGEAVGKALRDKELDMIVFCQLYGHMLAIGWRTDQRSRQIYDRENRFLYVVDGIIAYRHY